MLYESGNRVNKKIICNFGKKYLKAAAIFFCFLLLGANSIFCNPAQENGSPGNLPGIPAIPVPGNPFIVQPSELNEPVPRNGPHFAVLPDNPRPGDPVTIAYADNFFGSDSSGLTAVLIDSRGRQQAKAPFFSFTKEENGREIKTALLAIPTTAPVSPMVVRIETQERIVAELPLNVANRVFESERIVLDAQNTEIRSAPNPQREIEAVQLAAILGRTGTEVFADGKFLPPVSATRRTSSFGGRRVYQYVNGSTDTSIHAGVDIGVPRNTPVHSSAAGKVVLARFRIVSGYTIILEHYPGVYSLYFHLESLSVEEGDIVGAGDLVGLSGSTGLSTGPHLHWEIRVAGENADPDALTARALLDKDEIINKLRLY